MKLKTFWIACGTLAVSFLAVRTLSAAFTNPSTPSFRGQPDTEFSGWESFTNPVGQNLPDDPNTTSDDAVLTQTTNGAVLTGTGNIYSPAAPANYVLTDSIPGDLLEVHFQTSTDGAELAYTNVRLEYVDFLGTTWRLPPTTQTELARFIMTGPHVETLFVWDLSTVPDNISSYSITFQAQVQHLSLDAVLLDTRFEPAPAVLYCTPKSGLACGTPSIGSFGTPSASSTSGFTVVASPARSNRTGILLYTSAGRANLAFPAGGHILCIAPSPLRRGGPANSGGTAGPNCDGTFSLDMNAFASGNYMPGFPTHSPAGFLSSVGQTVNCQWWGRDSVATGSYMTGGVEYVVGL